MTPFEKARFFTWLHDQGEYSDIRELPGNRYALICRFAFTWAILVGRLGDRIGYDDRWCFSSYEKAKSGLDAWDGVTGEPQGWHRHPSTGRRREMSETGEVREHVWM
jgi:hypothetical protein